MRKKLLCFFAGLVFTSCALMAQKISDTYQFVYSTGNTYTALSGSTVISNLSYNGSANTDDGYASIPIGFTFNYGGTDYTNLNVDANGWASFGAAIPNNTDTWNNNLNTGPAGGTGTRPVLAPLWDDLYTDPGTISYQVNGSAPDRTLTVEWSNIYWTWAANNPVMSFQIVLHETSNIIDFNYESESDNYGDDGTHGASIGISGASSGDFLSVTPNGVLTGATSATENKTITTKLATGTTYSFIPYCSATIDPQYIGGSESIGRVRIGTIDQSTPALPSTPYHNYTNLYTFVQAGTSIPITINTNYTYSLDQLYIWIDFNHNGSFTDPGEEVFISSLPLSSATITTNLAIPSFSSSVLSGPTRMRIRLNDTGSPPDNSTPCGQSEFGDIQDFTINLQSCIGAIVLGQPANQTVCNGGNSSISINAIGTGLTYQWQLSTDGGTTYTDLTNTAPYSAVTTDTLKITGVTLSMSGYMYRCTMNGTCTTPNTESNAATLTINTAAAITTQPSNKIACQGANPSFTVAASGSSPTYQWQISTNNGSTFTNISGATTSTLNLTAVADTMNGYQYRCVATVVSCGSVNSNAAKLTVDALPTLSATLTELQPGLLTTITVHPVSTGVSYSWTFNGAALPGATSGSITRDIDGIGSYTATVTDVNGCTYTTPTPIVIDDEVQSDKKLWIYPNPAPGGQFQVRWYNPYTYEHRIVSIYSSSGVLVARKEFDAGTRYAKMDFSLPAVGPGVYIVKIRNTFTSGEITGKLVIQ